MSENFRVCGVDPGYGRLGLAIVERQNGRDTLLASTCVETGPSLPLSARLVELGEAFERLLAEHRPSAVAVETLFFNTNRNTAIGVAEARGVVEFLAERAGCTVHEYGPQEIKVAITGYGKSDKTAVIGMVKRLVANAPAAGHDDEYDAIAVAVTCLAHNPHNGLEHSCKP